MLVNRSRVSFIPFISDVHNAVPCEQRSVTCISAWHYAIKEVHASVNSLDYVCRRANAHKISRLILWHKRFDLFDNVIHYLSRLTHRQTANSKARTVFHFSYALHMLDTQILISTALIDTKQHLMLVYSLLKSVEPFLLSDTSLKPPYRSITACL